MLYDSVSNNPTSAPITEEMAFLQRLFMDSHQKRLTDPAAYKAPVDRDQVLAEIDAGASGIRCHETLPAMRRSLQEINEGGPLTIAKVADSFESMHKAISRPHDRCFHDFGVLALAGDRALLDYLITRANNLADGIQPGAKAELGGAFDRA